MILSRYPQLAVLSVAQALYWSCSIIGIALTALVGQRLAPWPILQTLPLALLVLGNLMMVSRIAHWMHQSGRRRGLQRGAAFGMAAGLLAALGVYLQSFPLFCVAMLTLGAYQASAGFYRFAALEGMESSHRARAASSVVAGGILAALLAPSLAIWSANLLRTPMAGAYLILALLSALAVLLLQKLPDAVTTQAAASPLDASARRTLRRALWSRPAMRQALCITACGHGLMILVMNATPLAMHAHGHALSTSTHVIQWHVLGMFLPSLMAGSMVDRFGPRPVAWAGTLLLAASAVLALSGLSAALFLVSSLLLGAGWNLMLIAGTALLMRAHEPSERMVAQPMMEWTNSAMAALMSFSCGPLMHILGWRAINAFGLMVLLAVVWWLKTGMNESQNHAMQQLHRKC